LETILGPQDILKILPHRFPFLLVDKVIAKKENAQGETRAGQTATVVKNVTFNEPFFTGHFPEMPIMPGVLQVEAMAQAACLAYSRKGDPKMDFFIGSLNDAKFRKPVIPGDTLIMSAEIVKDRGQMIVIRTRAEVDGQLVAEAEMLAKVTPRLAGVGT
jgi:beta-hydroxyacyl-ACP dehydratase FabZ